MVVRQPFLAVEDLSGYGLGASDARYQRCEMEGGMPVLMGLRAGRHGPLHANSLLHSIA